MHRFLALDLDGTTAPVGKAAPEDTVLLLRALEREGYTLCFCSGKPAYYLCGFARQLGLTAPILIGENGAEIIFGVDLPPGRQLLLPFPKYKKEALKILRGKIEEALGDAVWFQPNRTALTPFPQKNSDLDTIETLLLQNKELTCGLRIYRQCDCFDILPDEISKKEGLSFLARILNASGKDFIAAGDGANDLPMFDFADLSFGIGGLKADNTTYCYQRIQDALQYIFINKL